MERDTSKPAPRINVGATIRDWLHEVRLVQGCLDAQVDRLERIEREFVTLLGAWAVSAGTPLPSAAEPIAYNLDFRLRPDEFAVVAIDGGTRFTLAPQLAEVFQFVSSGEPDRDTNDSLAGWRSRADIVALVERSAKRSFPPRYVNNLVHRLRHALRKAGYDSSLIQTHRQKGVRLAYKRVAQRLRDHTGR